MEIHARWDIAAGEEITTSYLRPTKDTQTRRQLLAHSWHFWCTCPRCGDREEGGARLASIVCPSEYTISSMLLAMGLALTEFLYLSRQNKQP